MGYFDSILTHIAGGAVRADLREEWRNRKFSEYAITLHPVDQNAIQVRLAKPDNAPVITLPLIPALGSNEWLLEMGGGVQPLPISAAGARRLHRMLCGSVGKSPEADALALLVAIFEWYKKFNAGPLLLFGRDSSSLSRTYAVLSCHTENKLVHISFSECGERFCIEQRQKFNGDAMSVISGFVADGFSEAVNAFELDAVSDAFMKNTRSELKKILKDMIRNFN
jgi:hypothetical protein